MAEEAKKTETKTEAAQAAPSVTNAPDAAPTANGEQANAAPDLTISDLNGMKQILDVATSRGAFRANELEAVGKAYNKLEAFLNHVAATQQAAQANQAAPQGE